MTHPAATDAAPSGARLVETAGEWVRHPWEETTPGAALAAVEALTEARRLLDAALLAAVDRVETTGAVADSGWASTKELLTDRLGGHRGAGASWVRTAREVREIPQVRDGLTDGRLSLPQASAVGRAVARLPYDADLRSAVVEKLLELAASGAGATELQHAAPGVLREVDPDGAARTAELERDRTERGAHHARFLSFTPDHLGGVRIRGYGTVEDAERLRTVLFPLAAPVTSEPGACGGVVREPGALAPRVPCPDRQCDHTGRDPRDPGARLWDALVDLCEWARDADRVPRDHGARPRIVVTIDEHDLVDRLAAGHLLDGTPHSHAALRRLACDAEILPAVLGSEGQVLDVGRGSRLVTPGLWSALVLRDRHCAFPGCDRLPTACDAHHVVHWADGGPTSLDNMVMLCRHHHRLTHHSPWQVSIDPSSRRPVWTPPPSQTRPGSGFTVLSPGSSSRAPTEAA